MHFLHKRHLIQVNEIYLKLFFLHYVVSIFIDVEAKCLDKYMRF